MREVSHRVRDWVSISSRRAFCLLPLSSISCGFSRGHQQVHRVVTLCTLLMVLVVVEQEVVPCCSSCEGGEESIFSRSVVTDQYICSGWDLM